MANKELMDALAKVKTRMMAATGELVERSEPINIIHMLQHSTMMLRCEFTVMMTMLAEKRPIEEEEYFRRIINQVGFEVRILEKSLGISVDENGRVHKLNTPKLLKPGSSGLSN